MSRMDRSRNSVERISMIDEDLQFAENLDKQKAYEDSLRLTDVYPEEE